MFSFPGSAPCRGLRKDRIMSFEFYTENIGSFPTEPLANIFKKRIYLNRPAQRKYSIENTKNVLLGFDKDKQQICLKFIDSPQPGSRIIHKGGLSCKYFFDYFQISRPQIGLEIFDIEGQLIIQLKNAGG